MPGASGYDVGHRIRSVCRQGRAVVLVAVTDRTPSKQIPTQIYEAGFDCYMPKPVARPALLAHVPRLLNH